MADATLPPGVQALRDASARRVQDVRHVQFPRIGECASAADLAAAEEELHASLARITSLVQQVADEVEEGETTEHRAALQAAAAHDAAALEACVCACTANAASAEMLAVPCSRRTAHRRRGRKSPPARRCVSTSHGRAAAHPRTARAMRPSR